MRIGIISDRGYPTDPRIENIANSLTDAGHKVLIHAIHYDNKYPVKSEYREALVLRSFYPKIIRSISALAYSIPFYHWIIRKSLKEFIKENDLEAIYVCSIRFARPVFRINKYFKLPLTLDLFENVPEIMKLYKHVKSFPGNLLISIERWAKFERKFIENADKVVVGATQAADYYVKKGIGSSEKFLSIPNTSRVDFYSNFETEKEVLNRYKDNFVLLYFGDTSERRGLETVLDAMPEIIRHIPSVKLIIVGTSTYQSNLIALTKQLGVEQNVDFEGWQNFKLFPSYLLTSDIGLCPIHRNIHHNTTTTNKVFQYMSFGLPCIVSNCDSQEELMHDYKCGLVFKDKSSKDFASKVTELYDDKNLYNELSNNAKESVKKEWHWENTVGSLLSYYQSL